MMIPRLIRRDREQPRPQATARVEGVGRQVDLEEGLLEDVLRRRRRPQEPGQEVEQLGLETADERRQRHPVAGDVGLQQGFVAALIHGSRPVRPALGRCRGDHTPQAAATTERRRIHQGSRGQGQNHHRRYYAATCRKDRAF